ncbi:hypothetical protein BU23DRAFT_648999 [Bimuria novae-zelandiae CBS 107.79]|uniref:Uncharacterized protein n=1 Tax=Bimuria novae-zelandiae CBS 107.79 TaxID=1447943 RepID=A0A6A5V1L1_9PLEO|nr:hypothetical protein BU23DRAFT_648999 [Bimuria novae-zelandiae CBS 107.79]
MDYLERAHDPRGLRARCPSCLAAGAAKKADDEEASAVVRLLVREERLRALGTADAHRDPDSIWWAHSDVVAPLQDKEVLESSIEGSLAVVENNKSKTAREEAQSPVEADSASLPGQESPVVTSKDGDECPNLLRGLVPCEAACPNEPMRALIP